MAQEKDGNSQRRYFKITGYKKCGKNLNMTELQVETVVVWSLRLVRWDDPEGWYGEGGGRGDSGWGTCVHPWWIHVDVWQNQYNIVK